MTGPLHGIRVVDLSTVFAAPYMGGLLSDLGADVIKVEAPNRLDQTRGGGFGPYVGNDPGDDGWNWSGTFHSINRGKRSIVLDLKQQAGRGALRKLIDQADILLENFTPRVMRDWGMTYDSLATTNGRLIMLSNTGYGSSGPWSSFKAQGTTLETTMGLIENTGYEGDKPKKVGQSYPDFLACWTGLYAIHAALLRREESGVGQWIDLGMYQLGPMVIPEALIAEQAGEALFPPRIGDHEYDTLLSDVYASAGDDEWLAVAVVDEAAAATVRQLIGAAATNADVGELGAALGRWAAERDADSAAAALQAHGIPASKVERVRDLLDDPQYRARQFFEWTRIRESERPQIGRPYTWSGRTEVRVRERGPKFGEHNDEILAELGYSPDEIAELKRDHVVSDAPLGVPAPRAADLGALVRAGVYRDIDPALPGVLDRLRGVDSRTEESRRS